MTSVLYDNALFKSFISALETLAKDGPDSFYEGELANGLLQDLDGILTAEDLKGYQVETREAIQTAVGDFQVRGKHVKEE